MSRSVAMKRKPVPASRTACNGWTRQGTLCKRPPGAGTEHKGRGRCAKHGGNTRTHQRAAEREEALEQAAAWGVAVDVDPEDALLHVVHRSAGLAQFFGAEANKLKAPLVKGELATWLRLEREELDRLAKFSKMALDAGVQERRVRMAERVAEMLATAVEQALAPLDLSPQQVAEVAAAVGLQLQLLESGDVEGNAREVA